ncbi:hypothetical protein ACOME3_007526 [Neoechinorhynchus agilis]
MSSRAIIIALIVSFICNNQFGQSVSGRLLKHRHRRPIRQSIDYNGFDDYEGDYDNSVHVSDATVSPSITDEYGDDEEELYTELVTSYVLSTTPLSYHEVDEEYSGTTSEDGIYTQSWEELGESSIPSTGQDDWASIEDEDDLVREEPDKKELHEVITLQKEDERTTDDDEQSLPERWFVPLKTPITEDDESYDQTTALTLSQEVKPRSDESTYDYDYTTNQTQEPTTQSTEGLTDVSTSTDPPLTSSTETTSQASSETSFSYYSESTTSTEPLERTEKYESTSMFSDDFTSVPDTYEETQFPDFTKTTIHEIATIDSNKDTEPSMTTQETDESINEVIIETFDEDSVSVSEESYQKEYETTGQTEEYKTKQEINRNEENRSKELERKERRCTKRGETFQHLYNDGKPSCFMFNYCSNENSAPRAIRCPFRMQWIPGTKSCMPETNSCRQERVQLDHTPIWLLYQLECPPTASLNLNERSQIHMFNYYKKLRDSRELQNNPPIDLFTEVILKTGIYRHLQDSCTGFFKCAYKRKGLIHVLKEAGLGFCDRGDAFNQQWNWCVNRAGMSAGYGSTHPDSWQRYECQSQFY